MSRDGEAIEQGLIQHSPQHLVAYMTALADSLEEKRYARKTLRGYWSQWEKFVAYCQALHVNPLPANVETLRMYVAYLAQSVHYSTIVSALCAIKLVHYTNKLTAPINDPRVEAILSAARKVKGVAAANPSTPLTPEALALICRTLLQEQRKGSARDRAVLAVAFAGALRPGELASLTWEDISIDGLGVVINIPRSKTDQTSQGALIMLPKARRWREACPADALTAWRQLLYAARHMPPVGPIFCGVGQYGALLPSSLATGDVGRILRRRAEQCGIRQPGYGGYSMRAGWAVAAAAAGKPLPTMMAHLRHKNIASTAQYVRPLPWDYHPGLDLY